jgi:CheY-like chemotaxis protein
MNRTILMLEHDEDDRYITQAVFDEGDVDVSLKFVTNSQDLLNHLQACKANGSAFPSLILLNYHTYPLSASEVLKTLKADPALGHIPVVVLSGSVRPDIVQECYASGASSFIQKPSSSEETSNKISNFIRYWFETVELA